MAIGFAELYSKYYNNNFVFDLISFHEEVFLKGKVQTYDIFDEEGNIIQNTDDKELISEKFKNDSSIAFNLRNSDKWGIFCSVSLEEAIVKEHYSFDELNQEGKKELVEFLKIRFKKFAPKGMFGLVADMQGYTEEMDWKTVFISEGPFSFNYSPLVIGADKIVIKRVINTKSLIKSEDYGEFLVNTW